MKKRPIVLQAREVQAILAGHKTQLRRPYKYVPMLGDISQRSDLTPAWLEQFGANTLCPLGRAGQLLYVRETWLAEQGYHPGRRPKEKKLSIDYKATPTPGKCQGRIVDEPLGFQILHGVQGALGMIDGRWRSPVCMPEWASRLTLKIIKVELQRLHQVEGNPDDAAEEMGWEPITPGSIDFFRDPSDMSWSRHPDEAFPTWWDAVYGTTSPWEGDPWVWTITFERIKP